MKKTDKNFFSKSKCNVYNEFEEKKKVFSSNSRIIVDFSDLELLLNKYKNNNQFIFRGVNNATFKIYSSLHRYFIKREVDIYDGYICNYVEKLFRLLFKESVFITSSCTYLKEYYNKAFLDRYNIEFINRRMSEFLFSFHAFSILQHYRRFSPFLDFSENIYNALFFAIDDHAPLFNKFFKPCNFISLYVVDKNKMIKPFEILSQDDKKIYNLSNNIFSELMDSVKNITKTITDFFLFNQEVNYILQEPFIANPNIIAQNGCFVKYIHNSSFSLENFIGKEIICYDISKCLIPEIQKKIELPLKFDLFPKSDKNLEKILKTIFDEI